METIKIIILALSTLLLVFVGLMRLLDPIKTYLKNSGITIAKDVDLLNEMRGVSAVMLCAGLLIGLGTFLPGMTFSSFLIGALIFLGFAIGRFMSIAKDGKPNKQINQGIAFELVLGGANLFGLLYTYL
ncbi:DUF4345 domain-containing protein [Roseivirga sp. E12]|uniref:DUF4345 domain-containing protein n=1 Tax=Roseivirga sp. E12 TaxID=2819237 RepID=UPI001ABC1207|nr:DUF4345 domain-containing protein [Roseivirga sp. E12]MBO3696835.1 DUF4345 domain-containing protein [Roseivirga sp. E12]